VAEEIVVEVVELMEQTKSGVRKPGDGVFEFTEKEVVRGALREVNKPDVFKRSLGKRSLFSLEKPTLLLEGEKTLSGIVGEEGGRV
jgi:hypothetical protein